MLEIKRAIARLLKSDRPTGNFEVLGIEYCDREWRHEVVRRQITLNCYITLTE